MADKYRVHQIIEGTRITPEGEIQKTYKIVATSAGGTRFTLELPESQIAEKQVADALAAKARNLDAIKSL